MYDHFGFRIWDFGFQIRNQKSAIRNIILIRNQKSAIRNIILIRNQKSAIRNNINDYFFFLL